MHHKGVWDIFGFGGALLGSLGIYTSVCITRQSTWRRSSWRVHSRQPDTGFSVSFIYSFSSRKYLKKTTLFIISFVLDLGFRFT